MLTDYHLHLRPDDLDASASEYYSVANVERYRAAASERGIAELGVAEHVYRFAQSLDVWRHPFWERYAHDDLDEYCRFVREQTDLRLGLEADFVPGAEDRMGSLLAERDFDYVVGSVHFLREGAVDMDDYSVWSTGRSPDDIWRRYFQMIGESANSGLFDVLAHPDLVKFWGRERPLPDGDLRRYYEHAIEGIAQSGIAVEVSTAGLRKRAGEIYPAPAFLEMCLEAGAPVALSSDAHRPAGRRRRLRPGTRAARAPWRSRAVRVRAARAAARAHRTHRRRPQPRAGAERRARRLAGGGVTMAPAGIGYDSHRLLSGRRLIIGGVEIAHERGLEGHSDSDVLTHAVIDALLGAAGLGDIGEHFPDTDERWRDADSIALLQSVVAMVASRGLEIENVDCTVMMEAPKLAPHRPAIRASLAQALGLEASRVNVKATTGERMGFVGRGEGVAALAVAALRDAG